MQRNSALTDGVDVLILGGSSLARSLAGLLVETGLDVTTSLAGRTHTPWQLPGSVRNGGFGGVEGLAAWLAEQHPRCVVNAVHSFASTMSEHAATACRATGTPLVRLVPPSWHHLPLSTGWVWAPDHDAAATLLRNLPDPVLLTVGRQATRHYLPLGPRDLTHRVIDAPTDELPTGWRLLKAHGPFSLDAERRLMDLPGHRIASLVTKDSGGARPDPKLVVAEEIGAHVVVIERPPEISGVPVFGNADQAGTWIRGVIGGSIG